jgi:hypothetical protein
MGLMTRTARLTILVYVLCIACAGDDEEGDLESAIASSDAAFRAFCDQVEACYGSDARDGEYTCSVPFGTGRQTWGWPAEGGERESHERDLRDAYAQYPSELLEQLKCMENEPKARARCLLELKCPKDATPCVEQGEAEQRKCDAALDPEVRRAWGEE